MKSRTLISACQRPFRNPCQGEGAASAVFDTGAVPAMCAPQDPGRNRVAILAADASRRAALLVASILPVCALLAPGRAGASTPKLTTLFRPESLLTRPLRLGVDQAQQPARVAR